MTSGGTRVSGEPGTGGGESGTRSGGLYRRSRRLASELTGIALGTSAVSPAPGDWRFKDPAWTQHPVYRRLGQAYTANCAFADELLEDLARTGRSTSAARFLLTIAESAAAPTNTLLGNPAAMKHLYETGGLSLLRGWKNFLGDVAWNADGTNLTAALHAQFLDIFEHNPMSIPGALTCLGTPVDLSTITVPTYVTGGVTDHLTPAPGLDRGDRDGRTY